MHPLGLSDIVNRDASTVGWLFPAIIVAFLLSYLCKLLFPNRRAERPPITWVPLRNLPIDVYAPPPSWDDLVRAQRTAALDREDLPNWSLFVPIGLDILVLGARALYKHRTAVAPLKFVSGSLRRSWSPSDIAETYAAKVRQQGRDLIAEEVAQLDALRDEVIKKMNAPDPVATLNPSGFGLARRQARPFKFMETRSPALQSGAVGSLCRSIQMAICQHCGEDQEIDLHEVWSNREFMVSTCCEQSEEEVRWGLAHDPEWARALLRHLGIEAICGERLRRVTDDGLWCSDPGLAAPSRPHRLPGRTPVHRTAP